MAAHGFAGLRVPHVAHKVGKTQGAIYARFPSKEALALEAVRTLRDQHVMPRVLAATQKETSALGQVEAVSRSIAQFAAEDTVGQRMFARLTTELADGDSQLACEVRGMFQVFVDILTQLFVRGRARGEIVIDIEPRLLAVSVVCLPVSFMTASVLFDAPYEDLEAQVSSLLTRGLSHA